MFILTQTSQSIVFNKCYFVKTKIFSTCSISTVYSFSTMQCFKNSFTKKPLSFKFHLHWNENSSVSSFKLFTVHHTIAFCILTGICRLLEVSKTSLFITTNSCDDANFSCNPTAHAGVKHRIQPVIYPDK